MKEIKYNKGTSQTTLAHVKVGSTERQVGVACHDVSYIASLDEACQVKPLKLGAHQKVLCVTLSTDCLEMKYSVCVNIFVVLLVDIFQSSF